VSSSRVLLCLMIAGPFMACAKPHAGTISATPATHILEGRRLSEADVEQARAAGTRVDTIVVTPDHITLHVGESIVMWHAFSSRGLDETGVPVASFHDAYIVPPSTVFRTDGPKIVALSPGEGVIYVEALPRTTQARVRPSTAVRVVVVP
jgi:hypothetical protein